MREIYYTRMLQEKTASLSKNEIADIFLFPKNDDLFYFINVLYKGLMYFTTL